MIDVRDLVSVVLISAGLVFFTSATVGLFRFPDAPSRVHATSKADSAGLGLVVLGSMVQASSVATAVKLLAIWLLALTASAFIGPLIGAAAKRRGDRA